MVQNALQHIFWSIYFRRYAPGVVTSVLVVIPLGAYILVTAVQQGHAPVWYAGILAALIAAGLTQTVLAGKRMTPLIRAINQIGILVAERI